MVLGLLQVVAGRTSLRSRSRPELFLVGRHPLWGWLHLDRGRVQFRGLMLQVLREVLGTIVGRAELIPSHDYVALLLSRFKNRKRQFSGERGHETTIT